MNNLSIPLLYVLAGLIVFAINFGKKVFSGERTTEQAKKSTAKMAGFSSKLPVDEWTKYYNEKKAKGETPVDIFAFSRGER